MLEKKQIGNLTGEAGSYSAPKLTVFGSVRSLTHGKGNSNADGNGMGTSMGKG